MVTGVSPKQVLPEAVSGQDTTFGTRDLSRWVAEYSYSRTLHGVGLLAVRVEGMASKVRSIIRTFVCIFNTNNFPSTSQFLVDIVSDTKMVEDSSRHLFRM